VVHFVFLLLASCLACARGLSHRLADSLAVSHCRNRRARCFSVFESALFPSGADAARAASHLRDFLPVCVIVTPPRRPKSHEFWRLNGSFLNGLRGFGNPALLWKPCGNCFLQKFPPSNCEANKSAPFAREVLNPLIINGLLIRRPGSQDAFAS
jgi:hypothetical protein